MKNKLPYCNFELHSKLSASSLIFSHLKIKFLFSYVVAVFVNLCAVAAMLSVMAKLSAILKSEFVNTLVLLLLLERELKGIKILL